MSDPAFVGFYSDLPVLALCEWAAPAPHWSDDDPFDAMHADLTVGLEPRVTVVRPEVLAGSHDSAGRAR